MTRGEIEAVVLSVLDRAAADLRGSFRIDPKLREDMAFEIALALAPLTESDDASRER